jgi:pSer/pThr/pTyr-binding forkhead associated (FHA) protein
MVQLRILSGKMAGDLQVVRRFPFRIGRAADNDLRLDEAGVWDNHLTLEFQKKEGFILHTAPEAFAAVNEQPQVSARLRNGDLISFGSAKIQFWLAPASRRSLSPREVFVWSILVAVTAAQIALVYGLLGIK